MRDINSVVFASHTDSKTSSNRVKKYREAYVKEQKIFLISHAI